MANLNKVMLIGRLTRDPEARYTPSGTAVTEFGFAVNRYYTVNGERKEDTCFLDVSAWGRLGEMVRNYLRKGRQAYIEGHLTYNEWQTKEGQKRSKIRVVADNIQFLDSGDRNASGSSRQSDFGGGPPAKESPLMDEGGFSADNEFSGGELEAPF
ncbi:MAG: single-stranded DNA-binding protein [Planctomycetes bacterium]|nr:single-stranded DNA-binding protein [Planctomycetota bacterium]